MQDIVNNLVEDCLERPVKELIGSLRGFNWHLQTAMCDISPLLIASLVI